MPPGPRVLGAGGVNHEARLIASYSGIGDDRGAELQQVDRGAGSVIAARQGRSQPSVSALEVEAALTMSNVERAPIW
jgi:hypothetical protein